MTITERADRFEVRSDDGLIFRSFDFDDNPSRRAVTGKPKRKRALQEAQAFAGKGAVMLTADRA